MIAQADGEDFTGTDRFEIRRRLGSGGMGVVYQAWDRERGELVALKTLRRIEPAALYWLKREFRTLAGISHPHLVALHELVGDGDHWFFTMECLDGVDFRSWVSEPDADGPSGAVAQPVTETLRGAIDQTAPLPTTRVRPHRLSEPRLRDALRGLASGIAALHDLGYLHRDIKPTNVMVTPQGRVVLMDFGVAVRRTGDPQLSAVGTPAYIAPEQALGHAVEASDWYSVGVMLFEALTGDRPFHGDAMTVIEAKKQRDARSPLDLNPDAPPDLAALCTALLRRDPGQRPSRSEVLAGFGVAPAPRVSAARVALDGSGADAAPPLIGREVMLADLRRSHDDARRGVGSTVYVHGPSGMGKTALIERFLRDVRADPDAVVIAAKCYEQQSVPYPAVDGMVDALCQFLASLPRQQVEVLLPRHVQPLARVFPVLRRVEAVAAACRRSSVAPDPHELRRRAFEGLRDLLARLAERRPLVLVIDDLQWGDLDSAPLLADLMQPPNAPPLLFIASYRSEDADKSQLLRALFRRAFRLGPAAKVSTLAVEPLAREDATALARHLLGDGARAELAAEIAREAAGVPYLVHELVRFSADPRWADGAPRAPAPSLDRMIHARIQQLSPGARAILELAAIAGQPISRGVLVRALGGSLSAVELGLLHSELLVRTTGGRENDVIDVHHDRVRHTVLSHLPEAALRDAHLRIALALEGSGTADSERLAAHFLAAGDTAAGTEHALRAADAATAALAFDRAAQLYATVLELGPPDPDGELALRIKLADALANSGQGADAAAVYLAAAERADPVEADRLRRVAALQLLRYGEVDHGLAVLQEALAASGLRLARTPARALAALIWQRTRLRARGLGFRERDESQVAGRALTRIDVCWTAANGLGMVDPLRGAEIQARHLRLALRAGEPSRIARALAVEVAFTSLAGARAEPRVKHLIQRAIEIAERVGDPEIEGWLHTCVGLAEYQFGRFAAAREHCERAVQVFRDRCSGVWWQLATAELYLTWAAYYQGDFAALRSRVQAMLAEARLRGDRYTVANLKTGLPSTAWLAENATEAAREGATGAMESWSRVGFHLQHYWELLALAHTDLYAGNGRAAHERVEAGWPELERSLLLRIQTVRVEAGWLRGRAAVAAAAASAPPRRAELLAIATREARKIEGERLRWAGPFGALLRAGIARLAGDVDETMRLLELAERNSADAGLGAIGASARRLRGALIGGDQGAALRADAERWLRDSGVIAPPAMSRFMAPGIESTVES